jgi:translation initiation factor IF-1
MTSPGWRDRSRRPSDGCSPARGGCGTIFVGRTHSDLSKDDLIDVQGTVVAVHSGGLYRVQCDSGHEVLAQLSGRMRRFRIKVVPGDRVTVGVSPYDPVRGIITFRAR